MDSGGRRLVMTVLDQCRDWSARGCDLFVWIGPWPWPWAIPLCHWWLFIYFQVLFYLCFLVGFLLLISPYRCRVGLGGLCPVLCTQSVWSALVRWQFGSMIKWTQPPSGRMKRSVSGFISGQQHSRKAGLTILLHSVSFIFPVCHRYCKAIEVASDALVSSYSLLAIWCLLEYIDLVETTVIISGSSLDTYCNLRFRQHVLLLYSIVSLIKA